MIGYWLFVICYLLLTGLQAKWSLPQANNK